MSENEEANIVKILAQHAIKLVFTTYNTCNISKEARRYSDLMYKVTNNVEPEGGTLGDSYGAPIYEFSRSYL